MLESKAEQQQELGKGILREGTSSVLVGCPQEKELSGRGGDGLRASAVSTVHESCQEQSLYGF